MPAWNIGLSGEGNLISFIIPGCNTRNQDLSSKFYRNHSYNFLINSRDVDFVSPNSLLVGTGQVGHALCAQNQIENIGPAYNSNFSVIIPQNPIKTQFNKILKQFKYEFEKDDIRVDLIPLFYDSISTLDRVFYYQEPIQEIDYHIEDASIRGRDYKGTIYVISAPNLRNNSIHFSYISNKAEVIEVSPSTNKGGAHFTAYPSSSTIINVPTAGSMFVSSRMLYPSLQSLNAWETVSPNSNGGNDIHPSVAAGIISLIIESNKNLGYRDVQWILILTATVNDPRSFLWIKNAANIYYHPLNGFGRINANLSCLVAKTFKQLPRISSAKSSINGTFNTTKVLEKPLEVEFNINREIFFEHAYFSFSIKPFDITMMHIFLRSPNGTTIPILFPRLSEQENAKKILIRGFFGENAKGTWKAIFIDSTYQPHCVENLSLEIFGVTEYPKFIEGIIGEKIHGKNVSFYYNTTGNLLIRAPEFTQCGQNISVSIIYKGMISHHITEVPVMLLSTTSQRAICIGSCPLDGTVTHLMIPCITLDREVLTKIFVEVPELNEYASNTITIFNNRDDRQLNFPPPYSKFFISEDTSIRLSVATTSYTVDSGISESMFISLYDIEKQTKIASWMTKNRWNMAFPLPSGIEPSNGLFIITPLYIGEPDECSAYIVPVHLVNDSNTLQPFIVNISTSCKIDPDIFTQIIPHPDHQGNIWMKIVDVFVKLLPVTILLLLGLILIILTWKTKTRRAPEDLESLYIRS